MAPKKKERKDMMPGSQSVGQGWYSITDHPKLMPQKMNRISVTSKTEARLGVVTSAVEISIGIGWIGIGEGWREAPEV